MSGNMILSCDNIGYLPFELIIEIIKLAQSDTFSISNVCMVSKRLLDGQKLILNRQLLEKKKTDIIETIKNNSYMLSLYIKQNRIVDDVYIKNIYSVDCLNIITWNLYNTEVNKMRKTCSSCGSSVCGTASKNYKIHEQILEQYCKLNGSIKYCEKLINTLLPNNVWINKREKIKNLISICTENKSNNISNLLQNKLNYVIANNFFS